ncbi:T9SS type A sorting domain-containing protein [Crocinitomicaceae bacterium]|nr:T9SS type A sorting domain-containing protein [Crocinitomicaceae bacterium]
MKNALLLVSLLVGLQTNAQLADGSTAPDFTLDDVVDSNTYNLYSYLDQGKTCFVEIFAAHCPGCWGYHQAGTLKNLYNTYGPNGTDEVMVFALEYDEYNYYDAFVGIGPAWVTAGNWLDGTPYPIFQVEGADRTVFNDYNVTFYPVVYMVCPNKALKRVSTSLNAQQLYDGISDCSFLSLEEEVLEGKVYLDPSNNLIIESYEDVQSVEITNMQGQLVQAIPQITSGTISLNDLETGVYLFLLNTVKGVVVERFQVF